MKFQFGCFRKSCAIKINWMHHSSCTRYSIRLAQWDSRVHLLLRCTNLCCPVGIEIGRILLYSPCCRRHDLRLPNGIQSNRNALIEWCLLFVLLMVDCSVDGWVNGETPHNDVSRQWLIIARMSYKMHSPKLTIATEQKEKNNCHDFYIIIIIIATSDFSVIYLALSLPFGGTRVSVRARTRILDLIKDEIIKT